MGEGYIILPFKLDIRRNLRKQKGETLQLLFEA